MEIKPLRHVVTLAKTLNYTKAAQELNLSQSALTRSIQVTEQRSNLRIFDRDRGGVHLTPSGRAFVERALSLIREADDFDRHIQRMSGGENYEISFGMAPLPAKTLLPQLATEAFGEASDLRWRVEINSAPELLRLLLEEKIEFLLCAEEQFASNAPVKALPLGQFPLSFIVRKDHPLLASPIVVSSKKPAEILRYPVVSVAPIPSYGSFPKHLVEALEYPPKLIVNDYALLATIVSQSNAIWPTSSCTVLDEIKNGKLQILHVKDESELMQFNVIMYSLQKRSLSPAALRLQNHFRQKIQMLQQSLRELCE